MYILQMTLLLLLSAQFGSMIMKHTEMKHAKHNRKILSADGLEQISLKKSELIKLQLVKAEESDKTINSISLQWDFGLSDAKDIKNQIKDQGFAVINDPAIFDTNSFEEFFAGGQQKIVAKVKELKLFETDVEAMSDVGDLSQTLPYLHKDLVPDNVYTFWIPGVSDKHLVLVPMATNTEAIYDFYEDKYAMEKAETAIQALANNGRISAPGTAVIFQAAKCIHGGFLNVNDPGRHPGGTMVIELMTKIE